MHNKKLVKRYRNVIFLRFVKMLNKRIYFEQLI